MDNIKKVNQLIKENRIGMFVTQNDGKIFSRPIAYSDVDEANNIWFFTDTNSGKVDDIKDSSQVNFSFSNESRNEYVSVSGIAEIVKDKRIIEEKWQFFMKAWFPEGKESSSLTLIKVKPETSQFWDGSSSKIIQFYHMAKALATGKSYSSTNDSKKNLVEYGAN